MFMKNHLHERHIKRLEGENEKLKERGTELETIESELISKVKDVERQLCNMESMVRLNIVHNYVL